MTIYRFIAVYTTCASLLFSHAATAEQSGKEILSNFKNMQASYVLPNYKLSDDPEENFYQNLDTQMYRLTANTNDVLNDSYHYLLDNQNNSEVKNSPEYAKVKSMAKDLLGFYGLKAGLVNSGCLNSSSEMVRQLSFGVLQSAMYSINPSDCPYPGASTGAPINNKFLEEVKDVMDCIPRINTEEECMSSTAKKDGMFGYDSTRKFRITKGIARQKAALDADKLALLEYAYSGKCDRGENFCHQAKELFPDSKDGQLLANINKYLSGSKEIEPLQRARGVARLLRFASQNAIDVCTPDIYRLLQEKETLEPITSLSTDDLGCIYQRTKGAITSESKENMDQYTKSIRKAEKLFVAHPLAGIDGGKGREVGVSDRLNDTLESMIIQDPIAVGAFMIKDGSKENFANLCNTIKKMAKDADKLEKKYNKAFKVLGTAALIMIGGTFFLSGPIIIAATGVVALISFADAFLRSKREKRFNKLVRTTDSTGTGTRFMHRGTNEEAEFASFKREMDDRLSLMNKESNARFWKYFTASTGIFIGLGTTLKVTAKTIGPSSGGLNSGGKWIISTIAKGGPRGKRMAKSLAHITSKGDRAMDDLAHILMSNPSKLSKTINAARAQKGKAIVQGGEKLVTNRNSPTYWATRYSGETMSHFSRFLRWAKGTDSVRGGDWYYTFQNLVN